MHRIRTIAIVAVCLVLLLLGAVFFMQHRQQAPIGNGVQTEVSFQSGPNEPEILPDDKDRDGVSDKEEVAMGLSTTDFDTDGDGISDGLELTRFHTSPTSTDSDGDGFADGFEVSSGYNPAGPGKLPEDTLKQ